jgi:uncharacterized membrane protein
MVAWISYGQRRLIKWDFSHTACIQTHIRLEILFACAVTNGFHNSMNKLLKIVWLLTFALLIIQSIYYYSELPERIASHFDLNENPNGWSSKSSFYFLWGLLQLFVNSWVPLIGVILGKLPASMISIPQKKYWLATDDCKKKLFSVISATAAGTFAGINIIMIISFQHVVRINRGETSVDGIEGIFWLLSLIVIFAIGYPLVSLRVRSPRGGSGHSID